MQKHRKLALKLMLEQLENTPYSLEREEYKNLSISEIEEICKEINKVCKQFRKRYNLE